MKRVTSTEGIVGGSPCIEGTRLTCANVTQRLQYESVEVYLKDYPHIAPADIQRCLEYCSQKQCVADQVVNFCQQCTLDTHRNVTPEEALEEIWLIAEKLLRTF